MRRSILNLIRGRAVAVSNFPQTCSLFKLQEHVARSCINKSLNITGIRQFSSTQCYFQWLKDNTVKSHLPDISIPDNQTFHDFIFERCEKFEDNTALEEFHTGRSCTFGELKARSLRVAAGLHHLGLRKGDVVLCFSPNCIEFTVLMLAASRIGVCFSPANPTFTPNELKYQLGHGGAKAVFVSPVLADTARQTLAEEHEFPHVLHKLSFGKAEGFDDFNDLLSQEAALPEVDIDPMTDILTLPYSSGTTGLPKGVMLTHHNCLANCLQTAESVLVREGDRALGLLPLYHIYGMIVVQYGVLLAGASVVYLPKFEPTSFLQCIQDKKITVTHLVPPLIVFMAKSPVCDQYDLSSIRMTVCGAAPLGVDISQEFRDKYRHVDMFCQGYGLTETSPVTNIDSSQTLGCAGYLVANTSAKIVDLESGEALGPEQEGEYVVKGPQVMKGYLFNKKATEDMITEDGWLSTGDIGYFDKEGKLYIKDRLKELIKYKGSQVPPAELEAVMLGHPDIADCAVIGKPDEASGELPVGFVVRRPGANVTDEDIVAFVKERVRPTMQLRGGVQFIEEIPKNPSGKILRRLLRAKYL